jgi:hypothetical protein
MPPRAGSRIHLCQRRSMTLLRLAGAGGIMCACFPGSASVAGSVEITWQAGHAAAERCGARRSVSGWAHGRCQIEHLCP